MTGDRTDPGLQPQRTALAWSRTSLALFVNALAVMRAGTSKGSVAIVLLGALLLVIAAAAIVCGAWRRRVLMDPRRPIAVPTWLMRSAMAAMLLACGAGMGAILASAG